MRFKILKDSELFEKLIALKARMAEANSASLALIKKLGGETGVMPYNAYLLAGGIGGIHFKQKPENWKEIDSDRKRLYMPMLNRKETKEIRQLIKDLPRIGINELNDLLNFEEQDVQLSNGRSDHLLHPGMVLRGDVVLIHVDSRANYVPAAGMIEILESEYKSLYDDTPKETAAAV